VNTSWEVNKNNLLNFQTMVYKFLNASKIDSDNCLDWERHFRACMQQPRKDATVFILLNGELVLNAIALRKVETNTDWNVVRAKQTVAKTSLAHLSGLGKPKEGWEQIFLVKDKSSPHDNSWLHFAPNTVIEGIAILVFDSYERAVRYAKSRRIECSVWQFSETKFELLHDFGYQ
jgi:hypothetical protein